MQPPRRAGMGRLEIRDILATRQAVTVPNVTPIPASLTGGARLGLGHGMQHRDLVGDGCPRLPGGTRWCHHILNRPGLEENQPQALPTPKLIRIN